MEPSSPMILSCECVANASSCRVSMGKVLMRRLGVPATITSVTQYSRTQRWNSHDNVQLAFHLKRTFNIIHAYYIVQATAKQLYTQYMRICYI